MRALLFYSLSKQGNEDGFGFEYSEFSVQKSP